ncbi:hypothetical protein MTO96_022223 [Rhipicephalus appendiculatus]
MLHVLFFVISYCFTGGYISFLNMPILEEAPDTKEKLLPVLRAGRLQVCVWGNSFGRAAISKSSSAHISQLRAAVRKWPPFLADSLDVCAERTRRREAVLFASMHVLEWYEQAFRGQVEISNEFWLGFRPICYVLPRASPYENAVQNAKSDIVLHQVTMNKQRAFSTQFTFPIKYYNFAYLYPSPAALTGSFTVLKIFSIAVWYMFGVTLALLFLLLRGMTALEERSLTATHFDDNMILSQNAGPRVRQSQKPRLRILLVMLHFLFFMMSYCFTGGYISFLNMPFLEEAPDTKEKLLTVLRTGPPASLHLGQLVWERNHRS